MEGVPQPHLRDLRHGMILQVWDLEGPCVASADNKNQVIEFYRMIGPTVDGINPKQPPGI